MAGRWPVAVLVRAFLLALVVVGVALMHTLGHEHDDQMMMPMPAKASVQSATFEHTTESMADMPLALHAADHHTSDDAGSSHKPLMDPATVCMAILVALFAFAAGPLLGHILRSRAPGSRGFAVAGPAVIHGPSWPFSLAVTQVVVLRT